MKLEIRHKIVKRRVNWYDIQSFSDVKRFQDLYGEDYIYRVRVRSKANQIEVKN